MGDGSEGDVGGRGPQHDTSMVWLICPMASVLSEWVQARGRVPSTELALVREAVRERARRVMLADGTARAQRHGRGAQILSTPEGPEPTLLPALPPDATEPGHKLAASGAVTT